MFKLRNSLAFSLALTGLSPLANAERFTPVDDVSCDILLARAQRQVPGEAPSIFLKERVGDEDALWFRGGESNLTTVQVRAVSGNRPLVGAYFPAGNSGDLLMMEATKPLQLEIGNDSFAVQSGSDRGITSPITASNLDVIDGRHVLDIASSALSSVRLLRDHVVADHGDRVEYGMKPDEIIEHTEITPDGDLILHRVSLSGKARYTTRVHPLGGAHVVRRDGGSEPKYRLVGGSQDRIDFEVTMTTSEPPRVGVPASKLVEPWYYAQMTEAERQKLEFLFYEDGAVAGSHAYMTYFGRDPLITAMIAQDAFTPYALKIIARAALDTIDETGNIAHEPEIGERASLTRKQRGEPADENGHWDETPIYDYAMIDTQFLLMPVMELLVKKAGGIDVRAFLKTRSASGRTYGEQLTLNKDRIIREASAFALAEMNRPGDVPAQENYRHLIRLLEGRTTGQWRDSNNGLAGGTIPFETNAVLVPAALNAILNLYRLSLPGWDINEIETVRAYYAEWRVKPYRYFRVKPISAKDAKDHGDAYAKKLGLNPSSVDPFQGRPLVFYGVALDDAGEPIPLMHSDISFALLYTDPPADVLRTMLEVLRLPYPYGLDSPAGMFVATPAYANPQIQSWFGLTAYHAGIWSMQQEMLARGLARQGARTDLPADLRREVRRAHFRVWRAIVRNIDWRTAELWSARVENGNLRRMAYGTGNNIVAESCLNQFWSNTKIANFAPPGWEKIPREHLMRFLTWEGLAPLECEAIH